MLLRVLIIAAAAATSTAQTVYLIRHGEKPSSGNGLNSEGEQRAQCLRSVFSASSPYDIGLIMAETPQSDGSQQRPYDTVAPLAQDLGLTVDTSCERDDSDCVAEVVDGWQGPGNVLICWEHSELTDIVEALGDSDAPEYPDSDYGVIWTDPAPFGEITGYGDEDCPGLGQRRLSFEKVRMGKRR